jgi:GrpB-like predicted nucleotidyltransferase (UPF0157 family)
MGNETQRPRGRESPPPLGLESKVVRLVAYDPRWPALFAEESRRLGEALGRRIGAVEHIGSTAIPGMPAKPVLDLMAAVGSLAEAEELIPALADLGYLWRPRDMEDVPDRRYFDRRRQDGSSTHHFSLARKSSQSWRDQIAFRDYLRANPEAARTYAELKRDLAERFPQDRGSYIEGKTGFVMEVLKKAAGHGRMARET